MKINRILTGRQADRQTSRIDSLTGARFIAIMLIVVGHFHFFMNYGWFGQVYSSWGMNPTMGVDFFFMMSGFGMMLGSMRRDSEGWKSVGGWRGALKFGIRHVKKIYPIYVTMLLVGVPYAILADIFTHSGNAIKEIAKFPLDLTLLQATVGRENFTYSLNDVSWFLSSLFCIYLVSPFIMQWLKKHVKTVQTAMFGVAICILISFLLAIFFTDIEKHFKFFDALCYTSPYRRVFYVIPGMLLAQVYKFYKEKENYCMPRFLVSGTFEYLMTGLSIAWYFLWQLYSENYWAYIINMLIVACDLYALAIGQGIVSKFCALKTMVYLGNISMYIFITHYLIIDYVYFIVRRLGINSLSIAFCEALIVLVLTFLISDKLYKRDGRLAYFDHIVSFIQPRLKFAEKYFDK